MPNRIVWCDIPVIGLDRAIRFYSAVLRAPVAKQEFSGMSLGLFPDADSAVSGCLFVAGADTQPSTKGPLVYLNCSGRLDEAITQVEQNAGKILQPKHQIGPHGFRSVILDSEGNRIASHST